MPKSLTMVAEQAVLGGRPQNAGAILKENLDCQVSEALFGSVVVEAVLLLLDGCGASHPDKQGRAAQSRFALRRSHLSTIGRSVQGLQ